MITLISFNKFLVNFKYLKVRSGSYFLLNSALPTNKSFPNFALKINKLDFKKFIGVSLDKLDLIVLRAFRRIDKLLYRKMTVFTEVHFNVLANNFLNQIESNVSSDVVVYRRSSNFQLLGGRCLAMRKFGSLFYSVRLSTGYTKSLVFLFNSVLANRVVVFI